MGAKTIVPVLCAGLAAGLGGFGAALAKHLWPDSWFAHALSDPNARALIVGGVSGAFAAATWFGVKGWMGRWR